ncbi:MAG: alpha-glucosidase/alpha-galactosidase [Clostridia bacterium]|nr:alpha-glucosidase/alpha-galactosidase [Clostridia bacterium]
MQYHDNGVSGVKIAYIGGGSRGWAWTLMKDLALAENFEGEVALYDIDYKAAQDNEIIGNKIREDFPEASQWSYKAVKTLKEALTDANFVVVSILPGTFKEMGSDVHTPEKYGIYQPVGDTVGPGGIIRALRTIPMFEEIGNAVREYCPNAWVINYTNPMTVCTRTLYRVFPEIKMFGCCHEVFETLKLLCKSLDQIGGIPGVKRNQIKANVTGVNHFTWITEAKYGNIDLLPLYREYANKRRAEGEKPPENDGNWMNRAFQTHELVKFDLFDRYGVIAAAGDRHLAEFCPKSWYTSSPEQVAEYGFGLTPIQWRLKDLDERLQKSRDLIEGKEKFKLDQSGEEGVLQMKAILGLGDMVTNVNIPNQGQIPNLPLGAVVETNAVFSADSVKPVCAGDLPETLYGLIAPIVAEQELVVEAGLTRDLELAFKAFMADPHVQTLSLQDARALFDEMVENTKEYLGEYFN